MKILALDGKHLLSTSEALGCIADLTMSHHFIIYIKIPKSGFQLIDVILCNVKM